MTSDSLLDATAPSFDDPLGMLRACHGRIRRYLDALARLQRHLPEHGCDADARAAARSILRYFDTAAPNHHADEEESVFPRLLAARAPQAEAIIRGLERDHAELARQWLHLRPLLTGIVAGQRANLSPRDVAALRELYGAHIGLEEERLLPLAEATLARADIVTIGAEMAARRGVDPTAIGARRKAAGG